MGSELGASQGVFRAVVDWQRLHGRQGLPWQASRDPYRVWLSEIMLQQTQVVTVVRYYSEFLARFPDVRSLAAADVDDVLALWSGLGYYTRARNLHLCAQRVVKDFGGHFPSASTVLAELPGVGPSTAAAIAAFCFGERVSIFDGNVKRVLARFMGFSEDISRSAASQRLVALTQALVPADATPADMASYTQGLMDLGATLCTRSRPACGVCPLAKDCAAKSSGQQLALPVKTRRVKRLTVAVHLLLAKRPDGTVCLERRPPKGIWSSLWCFPSFADRQPMLMALGEKLAAQALDWPPVTHVLTHRDLVISATVCQVPPEWLPPLVVPSVDLQWVMPGQPVQGGIPVPVSQLLEKLASPTESAAA